MTRAERLEAARAFYAERRHPRPLPANLPDLLACSPRYRTAAGALVTDCPCGLTLPWTGALYQHLRGSRHLARVFGVSVRELVAPFMSRPHTTRTALAAGERRLRAAYTRKDAQL